MLIKSIKSQQLKKGKDDDYSIFDKYLDEHLDGSIAELSRLVAQPSVAAETGR
jgi:hypothetical protein